MMDFRNFTLAQWINVAIFALNSLALAAWWQSFFSTATAAVVAGALTYVANVLIFVTTGKAPANTPPAA